MTPKVGIGPSPIDSYPECFSSGHWWQWGECSRSFDEGSLSRLGNNKGHGQKSKLERTSFLKGNRSEDGN